MALRRRSTVMLRHPGARAQRGAVEAMERVDDPTGEAPRPARVLRRHLAGDAERDQRGDGGAPAIALHHQSGGDQRRAGAAHGGDQPHQRVAIGNFCRTLTVGHHVGGAGERDHRVVAFGKARRRVACGIAAGKGCKFVMVEPHRGGLAAHQALRELRPRRRAFDEDRVEHPGFAGRTFVALPQRAQCHVDRRAPLGIEGAEIDQERIGTGDEGRDFLGRNRHRRDGAGREQHVRRIGLRHRIGDAMHPRRPAPDPRQHVGGDVGKFGRCTHDFGSSAS